MSGRKPQTNEWFKDRVKEIHGNDEFGFDKCDYEGNRKMVTLFCYRCRDYFEMRAMFILRGGKCNKCRRSRTAKTKTLTTDKFVKKAVEVHADTYDYSRVEYSKTSIPVTIICKLHGAFQMQPSNHLQGQGCKKCNNWSLLEKTSADSDGVLYWVRFSYLDGSYAFDKIGITTKNSWKDRFCGHINLGYTCELVKQWKGKCIECLEKERDFFRYLDSIEKRYKVENLKNTHLGGWTECFFYDDQMQIKIEPLFDD